MDAAKVREVIEEYLPKITGFAHLKSCRQQDAEDLAQDIAVEVVKSLGREQGNIENLAAYIYRISGNVFYRRVRQNHKVTYVELTGLEHEDDHCLDNYIGEDETALLRREISFLSSTYRDVVVQYYYDGLSVRDIARQLAIPEGTVKWWLFEARKQLRKGFDIMRPNGEKSFNPGSLHIGITGTPGVDGSPFSLVRSNLIAQNILLSAYGQPVTIEQLSQELGVACPYVESEVAKLAEGELLKRDGSNYRTNFIISNSRISAKNQMILEEEYPKIKSEILEFINSQWDFFSSPEINPAGFERKRILWVAVHLVMDLVSRTTFRKIAHMAPLPQRPNGGSWIAFGGEEDKGIALHEEHSPERYSYNGSLCSDFDNFSYGERVLYHQFSGLDHPDFDREIIIDTSAKQNHIILFCIKAAKNRLPSDELSGQEKQCAAEAMKYGLIVKDGGMLKPNFMFFPKSSLSTLQTKCSALGEELVPAYRAILDKIAANFREWAPESIYNQIAYRSVADFGSLTPMILDDLYKAGELSEPRENDKHLLSYYIWA